jgi:hypothetical protein
MMEFHQTDDDESLKTALSGVGDTQWYGLVGPLRTILVDMRAKAQAEKQKASGLHMEGFDRISHQSHEGRERALTDKGTAVLKAAFRGITACPVQLTPKFESRSRGKQQSYAWTYTISNQSDTKGEKISMTYKLEWKVDYKVVGSDDRVRPHSSSVLARSSIITEDEQSKNDDSNEESPPPTDEKTRHSFEPSTGQNSQ